MRFHLLPVLGLIILTNLSCSEPSALPDGPGWHDEIIYHVMPRSFYDSNGDRHGDLNGFREKLGYLKELGVTTILFTPLYESDFYHNYFPTDYEKIDPEYGTMEDYIRFVEAVHDEGLKFLMDMETQYVQNGHLWFEDSYRNPQSEYSDYIFYHDSLNTLPDQFFRQPGEPLQTLPAWPDQQLSIVYLNLNHSRVRNWLKNFYAYWVDPNGDGNLSDGIDGFRIDHIMDDLDYKGVFTNMYADVWKPVFEHCRTINPDLFIVGEQSDWTQYGEEMMLKSGADAAFGFPVRFAISGAPTIYMGGVVDPDSRDELNASKILRQVEETLRRIPEDRYVVNFIENHDTERWASAVSGYKGKIRSAAVLNILLPGIPSIYYGQELGVTGTVGEWGHDGNHIPVREAFPWTPGADAEGMAVWYKDTGPWWDQSFYNSEASQALALSVQKEDPESLWHHYQDLITLRKSHAAFTKGDFQALALPDTTLLAFARTYNQDRAVVVVNLSDEVKSVDLIPLNASGYPVLYGREPDRDHLRLDPFGFSILMRSGPQD